MTTSALRRQVKNIVHNYSEAEIKVLNASSAPQVHTFRFEVSVRVSVRTPQVREATSNDPWGPSSSLMSEIADLTFNVVAFAEVMGMVWKRLNDSGKNWRHVYKVLYLRVAVCSPRCPFPRTLQSWLPPSGPDSAGLPAEDGLRARGSAVLRERLHHSGRPGQPNASPAGFTWLKCFHPGLCSAHYRISCCHLSLQTLRDFQYVDRDGRDQGANVREKARQLVCLLRDEDRLHQERSQALKTKERMAGGSCSRGGGGGSGGVYGGIPPSYHPGRRTSQPSMAVLYGEEFSRSRGSPSSFNCEFCL